MAILKLSNKTVKKYAEFVFFLTKRKRLKIETAERVTNMNFQCKDKKILGKSQDEKKGQQMASSLDESL